MNIYQEACLLSINVWIILDCWHALLLYVSTDRYHSWPKLGQKKKKIQSCSPYQDSEKNFLWWREVYVQMQVDTPMFAMAK